jgi:hypothetical protein
MTSQSPTPSDRSAEDSASSETAAAGPQPDSGESTEIAAPSPAGRSARTAAAAGAAADAAEARRAAARRRRRIDEVFGDVLPATTDDERESGHRGGFSLEHYRSSRPPHWGDKQ